MSRPIVSIIIPVYNAESTLQRALDSAIGQTLSKKEIIVIDGGSDDGSVRIAENNRAQLTYFISEKDSGVYDAINKGLDKATGEWIYILGADDYLSEKNTLSKVLASASDHQLVFGWIKNENIEHRLVPVIHKSEFGKILYWKNALHQQSVCYHRSLFEDFRFDISHKVLADYDFHLSLLKKKTSFTQSDEILAHCEASGLSKQFTWSLYREELHIKRKRLPVLYYLLNIPFVFLKYLRKKFF